MESQPPKAPEILRSWQVHLRAAVLWWGLAEPWNSWPQDDSNIKKVCVDPKNRLERMQRPSTAILIYILEDITFFPGAARKLCGLLPVRGNTTLLTPVISASFLLQILNFVSVQLMSSWGVKGSFVCPSIQCTAHTEKDPTSRYMAHRHGAILLHSSFMQDYNLHRDNSPDNSGTNHGESIFITAAFALVSALDRPPLSMATLMFQFRVATECQNVAHPLRIIMHSFATAFLF